MVTIHLSASKVGLTLSAEDVDAAHLDGSSDLILSGPGNLCVTGASGADEDLLRFTPTTLGATTAPSSSIHHDTSTLEVPTGAEFVALHIE